MWNVILKIYIINMLYCLRSRVMDDDSEDFADAYHNDDDQDVDVDDDVEHDAEIDDDSNEEIDDDNCSSVDDGDDDDDADDYAYH